MDAYDLGKKALFLILAIVIVWLGIYGQLGRGFACVFCPGALVGDTTSDGSGSTSTSTAS